MSIKELMMEKGIIKGIKITRHEVEYDNHQKLKLKLENRAKNIMHEWA
jgi:hypothetical protein